MESTIPFARWFQPATAITSQKVGEGTEPALLTWDCKSYSTVFDGTAPDYARGAVAEGEPAPVEVTAGSPEQWALRIPISKYRRIVRTGSGDADPKTLIWVKLPFLSAGSDLGREVQLTAQTVRLLVNRFTTPATNAGNPEQLLAGLRITGGKLSCTGKMRLTHGVVTIPADAVLTLEVTVDSGAEPPSRSDIAPDASVDSVTLPATATFQFDPASRNTDARLVKAAPLKAEFTSLGYHGQYHKPAEPAYFELGEIKALIFPFSPTRACAKTVDFKAWKSIFVQFSGSDKLASIGWALPVAQLSGGEFPELMGGAAVTLETAGADIPTVASTWQGLDRPVAWNRVQIALSRQSLQILCYKSTNTGKLQKSPPAVQRLALYESECATAPGCRENSEVEMRVIQNPPAGLSYVGVPGVREELVYVAKTSFRLHQLVTSQGKRMQLENLRALVQITRLPKQNHIAVLPIPDSAFSTMESLPALVAFENGLLALRPREWYGYLMGVLDSSRVTSGIVLSVSRITAVQFTLPDPYVTSDDDPRSKWRSNLADHLLVMHTWPGKVENNPDTTWLITSETEETSGSAEPPDCQKPDYYTPVLLDVSGRADQFGVGARLADYPAPGLTLATSLLRAEGAKLVLKGNRLFLVTLPPFSWEPMLGLPIGGSQRTELLPTGFRPAWLKIGFDTAEVHGLPFPNTECIFHPSVWDEDKKEWEYPEPTRRKYPWRCTWKPYFDLGQGGGDKEYAPYDNNSNGWAYPWEYEYRIIASDPDTGDGGLAGVHVPTQKLVAMEPTALAEHYGQMAESGTVGAFKATLGLPFGLTAHIDSAALKLATQESEREVSISQDFAVTRPYFGIHGQTRLQLSFTSKTNDESEDARPARFGGQLEFAGFRDPGKPDFKSSPGPGYAQRAIGVSVTQIARNEFRKNENLKKAEALKKLGLPAVPLLRYDLSGYGASLFSNWRDFKHKMVDGGPTCVSQMQFAAMVGRVAQEKVVVDSIIHPWGIKVRRTVTMERKQAGWVLRQDSGWIAISGATFDPFHTASACKNKGDLVHKGLVDKIDDIEHIREIKDAVFDSENPLLKQAVLFDGLVTFKNGLRTPLRDAWGYIPLDVTPPVYAPNDEDEDKDEADVTKGQAPNFACDERERAKVVSQLFADTPSHRARGRIECEQDLLNSGFKFRATEIEAAPLFATPDTPALCLAVGGTPILPDKGAWSVTYRGPGDTERRALPQDSPVPLIQPNRDPRLYFSAPEDLFRVNYKDSNQPRHEYAFLQDTGTQKLLQPHPRLGSAGAQRRAGGVGTPLEGLEKKLPFGDIRSLLGATGLFPDDAKAVAWELLDNNGNALPLGNFTPGEGLKIDLKKLSIPDSAPESILDTDLIDVRLWYCGSEDGVLEKNDDPSTLDVYLDGGSWRIAMRDFTLVISADGHDLFGITFSGSDGKGLFASNEQAPSLIGGKLVYSRFLKTVMQILEGLKHLLEASGTTRTTAMPQALRDGGGSDLQVNFTNGALNVSLSLGLPTFPLGPGELRDVSFNLGGALRLLPSKEAEFGISLGTAADPITWIATPLAGNFFARIGVSTSDGMQLAIQGGLGLGVALNVAVASGHASIIIALRVEASGSVAELTALLTGNAGVDVMGGVASASLELESAASIDTHKKLSACVAVGIHVSIAWVIDVDFEGDWPFETTID